MLSVRTWTTTLAAWFGLTFILCVGWCVIAPEGWNARGLLELALPGFHWLSAGSFLLGLTESIATGAYAGASIAALHNAIGRLGSHEPHGAARAST